MKNLSRLLMMIILFGMGSHLFTFNVGASEVSSAKVITENYKEAFLKYPQVTGLKNSEGQKKINGVLHEHIQSSYKAYLKLMEEMENYKKGVDCKKQAPICEYSYSTYYDVKYNQDGRVSILFYDATYSGGAHGLEGVTTYNFNLKTGEKYSLDDLVSDQSKYIDITDYVRKYMREHQEIFFDEGILKDFLVNKDTQFYFTDEGIDLIFQQYEVAPYAVGHPTISIPSSLFE